MNDSETGGVGSCGGTGVNSLPNQTIATQLLTGSPVSGVSHLSANLLDPVAAAVHRRRSSAIMSADATGFCRICRKVIMKDESAHRCSNCAELVCDDCSSYSARDESKVCLQSIIVIVINYSKCWSTNNNNNVDITNCTTHQFYK